MRKAPSKAQRIAREYNGWLRNVSGSKVNALQIANRVGMKLEDLKMQFAELELRIKMQRDKLLQIEKEKKLV